MANASRDAMIIESNNNLLAAQAAATQSGILESSESSKNSQSQTLAWRRRWRI